MSNLTMVGAGAAGGSVGPSSIAGLQAWYKADAGTSTTTDGVAISQWDDQSGNTRHLAQATGLKQPLYKAAIQNSLPIVRFDGTDDRLGPVSFTLNQPCTCFLVTAWRSAFVANETVLGTPASLANFLRNSATDMKLFAGSLSAALTTTPQSFHAYCVEFNGASSALRADGGAAVTSNAGATNPGGVSLGAQANDTEPSDVDVGELVVYNSVLSAADRQAVESYLRGRWATP